MLKWDLGTGFNDRQRENLVLAHRKLDEGSHLLEIKRLGAKNPQARGAEVWVTEIRTNRDVLREERLQALLVDHQASPGGRLYLPVDGAIARYQGIFSSIQIVLVKHPHSGHVRISLDGIDQVVDLYDSDPNGRFLFYDPAEHIHQENWSLQVALPQLDIRGLRLEAVDPGRPFQLLEWKIAHAYGQVTLPLSDGAPSSRFESGPIRVGTESLHPVLLSTQLLVALAIGYAVHVILPLPRLLRVIGWAAAFRALFLEEKRLALWLLLAVSTCTFTLWLLGQWPGLMTGDSSHIWRRTIDLSLDDAHPWPYYLYILGVRQILDSPAMIGVIQLVASSAVASFAFYYAIKEGVSLFVVLPLFAAFISMPAVGVYNLTIWKDTPFAILVGFWALYLFHLGYRKAQGMPVEFGLRTIVALAVLLVLLCRIRHNGIVYLGLIPMLLVGAGLMPKRRIVVFLGTVAILLVCVKIAGVAIGVHLRTNYRYFEMAYRVNPIASLILDERYRSPNVEEDKRILENLTGMYGLAILRCRADRELQRSP